MDSKKIGAKLITLRGEMSQAELATAIGVSTSTIGMYERGERIPKDEIKIRIAKFFGLPVQKIFYE